MSGTPLDTSSRKPLRLWPGIALAIVTLLVKLVVPEVVPDGAGIGVIGGVVGGLLILLWWLFFSRAPWEERLGVVTVGVAAVFALPHVVHASLGNGMMGMMPFIYGIPLATLALAGAAVAARRLTSRRRGIVTAAAIVLACLSLALLRTGGLNAAADSDFHWRWTPTPEDRLLAQANEEPAPVPAPATIATEAPAAPPVVPDTAATAPAPAGKPADEKVAAPPAPTPAAVETTPEWPGFRGPRRDDVARGVQIDTDWTSRPPAELWRRAVGPGWSSFAVDGDLIYTQEQRGDDEVVACYRLSTGQPVWRHRDAARFWESNAGAGPRGTPTLSHGRVYTFGATGIVNALDARTGAVLWSRNAATDTGTKTPMWGFASSPLAVDDLVVVATAGRLIAYNRDSGAPRWRGSEDGGGGYSSPHLITIDGVTQILLMSNAGIVAVAPEDGAVLWKHDWPGDGIVQPNVTADGEILLGSGSGMGGAAGVRRIALSKRTGTWAVRERWTSNGLKPYFNDFVVHNGHAYGFDGSLLACIDLADGTRKWKGGRYGHGQLILLPDQDALLVISEEGELALVKAAPDTFTEIARAPALDGKTWNHPVVVGHTLLVRNDQEMVAFRLPVSGS